MNRDCWENCALGSCPEYPCEEVGEPAATFYVYVAGRLSGDPGEYLANVAALALVSRRLLEAGYCPVNPAADALEGLASLEALPVVCYQRRSLELLRLLAPAVPAAALLVTSTHHRDGRISGGVAGEIAEAERLGIPIVHDIEALNELRRGAG